MRHKLSAKNKNAWAVHPGEVLKEEFLDPLQITARGLASDLHIPIARITDILNEQRRVSADTALRLARYFGTSPEFWMNLQALYDLRMANIESQDRIEREVHPRPAA